MGRHRFPRMLSLRRFHSSTSGHGDAKKPAEAAGLEQRSPQPSSSSISGSRAWEYEDEMLTPNTARFDSDNTAVSFASAPFVLGGGSSSAKSVRFGGCSVRRYSQVLGDHPCCSIGCPLELGWDYQAQEETTVDNYEATRPPSARRCSEALRLTWEERREILQQYSDGEVRKACRRLNRDRSRRIQKEFFCPQQQR